MARLVVVLLLGLLSGAGCAATPDKIRFPLAGIRADGLAGPPDGLVSIDYEFLVPADPVVIAEVRAIDPSLRVSMESRGRVGRGEGQALCLGNTHQPGWRQVLERLAARPDVGEIRRNFAE